MPSTKKKSVKSLKSKPKKNLRVNNSHELHSKFVRRLIAYGLFGVLTILLTFLVFYRAKGYTFNKNGEVIRRGIVLIDAAPQNAKILLDDKEVDTTEAKLEVNEGTHTIKLEADGYRTWRRSFNMQAEKVRWFFYPYLIPTSPAQEQYLSSQVSKQYSEANAEGRMLAISKEGESLNQKLSFELINLKEDDSTKSLSTLQPPSNLFTPQRVGGYGSFRFIEWSPNGDSILIEHTFDDKTELVNLRLGNLAESLNLNNSLNITISEAHYDERSRLNILAAGDLALYNPKTLVKEQSVSTAVTSFENYDENIYVYSKSDIDKSNIYIKNGQNTPVLVSVINTNDVTQFDYEYLTNRRIGYLAVSSQINKELQVYKGPFDALPSANKLSPLYLSTFSQLSSADLKASPAGSRQPGKYVAMQLTGSKMLIYDFEEEESFSYDLKVLSKTEQITEQSIEQELNISEFAWLDPQRLQARTVNGDIYYFDYDGNYLNLIGNESDGLSSFVKSKNSSFITSKPSGTGALITKVKFKQ